MRILIKSIRETRVPIYRPYRDLEKRALPHSLLSEDLLSKIWYYDGVIDGGGLGGISLAMDNYDPGVLDGGEL